MYEDSWYSYIPDTSSRKDELQSHVPKHNRRESLLKQTNGVSHDSEHEDPILELFEENSLSKGPPKATLARRARSYSDFYDVAVSYLGKPVKIEEPRDALETFEATAQRSSVHQWFEDPEDDLLHASREEYHLYRDQLALSERHLDNLLENTSSALELLASLSESFKSVESETVAFQSQCEDLLTEQKRLRKLADEVGIELQYYAYLEPLTRRLNAPGAGRLVRNDDFLDMLLNLNTCIDFMDQHPGYRDSSLYKTRYTQLLERSLNLIQIAFSNALKDVTEDAGKQLKSKEQTETAEYILLYGKYETALSELGSPLERILKTSEFAFDDPKHQSPYTSQWHELYRQLVDIYIRSREPVGPLVLKNLRKFATGEPKPEADFKTFARRCIQYVFDICHNELDLQEKAFQDGLHWNKNRELLERLEQNRFSHVSTLSTFLNPFLSNGDLSYICGLTTWLETVYLTPGDDDDDVDRSKEIDKLTAHVLLDKYLWPLSDTLFLKAAKEIEHYRPTMDDLKVSNRPTTSNNEKKPVSETKDSQSFASPGMSSAFPTVRTAVKLLIMYNDGVYDRPRTGDVLYEIVHQATESLQKAATTIKRNSTIMDAQLFLIKNLMLIENLFMTHEIPDSVRQSAEFDFTPIWDTIKELQDRRQLFNPLAYFTPLLKGKLLPAVVDHLLDARKELEKVLVQQITAFTKTWQARLGPKARKLGSIDKAEAELDILLRRVFEDETTRAALWKMIRAEEA